MNIAVNVKECYPEAVGKLMGDMAKLAGHETVCALQVNLELIAGYPAAKPEGS